MAGKTKFEYIPQGPAVKPRTDGKLWVHLVKAQDGSGRQMVFCWNGHFKEKRKDRFGKMKMYSIPEVTQAQLKELYEKPHIWGDHSAFIRKEKVDQESE